jgi:hypothetical protein
MDLDRNLAREAVSKAATLTEAPEVAEWLHSDPKGYWEERASDCLRQLTSKGGEIDTEAAVTGIARLLCLWAIKAEIKRRKGDK